MLMIFTRLLSARAIAGCIGLVSMSVAISLLPSEEYARAALAISYSAIVVTALYLPFSKYLLLFGEGDGVVNSFRTAQRWTLSACLGLGLFALVNQSSAVALLFACCLFAVSQGCKDFAGELLRSRNQIGRAQNLYLLDSVGTLAICSLGLLLRPRAEIYLICSAASSFGVSASVLLNRVPDEIEDRLDLRSVYRYSSGVVGSGVLNSASIALARSLFFALSPKELAGGIQFALDILQRIAALTSSTLLSVAIPRVRSSIGTAVPNQVLLLMTVMLPALIAVSILLEIASASVGSGSSTGSYAVSVAGAVFVWISRYKSTAMDFSLTCSPTMVKYLPLGSVATLAISLAVWALTVSLENALLLMALAMAIGGMASLWISCRGGATSRQEALRATVPPIVAVSVVAATNVLM